MAERQTLLARPSSAPVAQPVQQGAPRGAFGDYRGMIALGEGIQDVGQVAQSHAARLKAEMDHRTANDYKLKADNIVSLAARGVREEYNQKLAAGEMDEAPYAWMEERLARAKSEVSSKLAEFKADPIFKKVVPDAAIEGSWMQATDSLLTHAAGHEGQVKMQDRLDNADVMVAASFSTTEPSQHEETVKELSTKLTVVDALVIPRQSKNQLKRQLADRAYDRVMQGLDSGFPVSEDVIKNPNFTPGQQRMINIAQMRLTSKEPMKASEANNIIDSLLTPAVDSGDHSLFNDPKNGRLLLDAAGAIAANASTPEGKRFPFAKIELAQKQIDITRDNFASLPIAQGRKLYQRLTELNSQLSTQKGMDEFYAANGVHGASDEDRSRFITAIKADVQKKLDLVNTGRANELVDAGDAVAPVAKAATSEFLGAGITQATAQRYVRMAKLEQTELGIPENLQVSVPAGVARAVIDRVWNGDTNNGSRMITEIGSSFGADALGSVAQYFLAPTNAPKQDNGASLDATKARSASYAALFKIAASDHARVEAGARNLELQPFLKQWMDDLGSYEKNSSTYGSDSAKVAEKAYLWSTYNNPVSEEEALTFKQIRKIFSRDQSLPGIESGLMWQSGQNADMASGFREFIKRVIQSKSNSSASGPDKADPLVRARTAANTAQEINNILARVFTVVPVAGVESTRAVYDLWPTKLVKENAFEIPKTYGAADAVDLSDQMSGVLKYVGFYEPRRHWERGTLANFAAGTAQTFRDMTFISPFFETGSADVKTLPAHLTVDWEKIHGITPEQFGTGGEKAFKDYLENPKSRYTVNSVAFTQSGAWRYNWKTNKVEAMIFPGRANSAASPSVANPGPAQPLLYNFGSKDRPVLRPVTLDAEDIRKFDSAYRARRGIVGQPQPGTVPGDSKLDPYFQLNY